MLSGHQALCRWESLFRFHTRSGVLTCTQNGDFIDLDVPATPSTTVAVPTILSEAFGAEPCLCPQCSLVIIIWRFINIPVGIDSVFQQYFHREVFDGGNVRRSQSQLRCEAGFERFDPARKAQAPAITGL